MSPRMMDEQGPDILLQAPPPQKKQTGFSQKVSKEYGGAGDFIPISEDSKSNGELGRSDTYMTTIRPSNSSAKVNLYMPSYEPRPSSRSVSTSQLVNDFGELGMNDHSRRSSTYP